MRERTGDELLGLPVRLHGIQLGRPVDLLSTGARRAVGLDLLCGDEVHRFLPLPTAAVERDEIRILSPFVLLEQHELDFYRSRTLALGRLRGRPVERNGRKLGALQDVVVAEDGRLIAAIVADERVPFDAALRFAPKRRSAGLTSSLSSLMDERDAAVAAGLRARVNQALRQRSNWAELAKFCAVGASGYVVNLLVYVALLDGANLHYRLAATGSFLVAVTNNYLWNRLWTFRRDRGHFAHQGLRFFAVSVIVYLGNLAILTVLVELGAREDRRAGDRDRSRHAGELHRQQALVVPETALRLAPVRGRRRARGSGSSVRPSAAYRPSARAGLD